MQRIRDEIKAITAPRHKLPECRRESRPALLAAAMNHSRAVLGSMCGKASTMVSGKPGAL
jgi:hypothetical protein